MSRKSLAMVAIAVALGVSLAVAITAGSKGASAASGLGTYGSSALSQAGVADTATTAAATAAAASAIDPAKQEPVLDKFTSKDPFYDTTLSDTVAAASSSPTPSATGSSQPTPSASSTVAGHTIKVLSINTQNDVSSATFVVDGKTYADKAIGDVFSTGAGQIKVVSINAGAQTVSVLRGDESLTLSVGQSVSK